MHVKLSPGYPWQSNIQEKEDSFLPQILLNLWKILEKRHWEKAV
jgi:hypothetical protein